MLALFTSSVLPGAMPSSASGSFGAASAAWLAVFTEASSPEPLIADPSKTKTNAKARPVSPMRIRFALLPVWSTIGRKLWLLCRQCKHFTLTDVCALARCART
jgi:hypothetical protein